MSEMQYSGGSCSYKEVLRFLLPPPPGQGFGPGGGEPTLTQGILLQDTKQEYTRPPRPWTHLVGKEGPASLDCVRAWACVCERSNFRPSEAVSIWSLLTTANQHLI